ncbi:MAG TPA: hypothetical protein PLU30_20885 [Verrucomicrobiae bacterium]|nr:hypothetical protein [Verrucomicrobiae bacterium]
MSKAKGITAVLMALALGLVVATPAFARGAREQKVQIKDCPDAVLRTIRKQAGKGRILEIEKERKKCGRCVYEAKVARLDGVRLEVEVGCCGKLLEVEVED